VGARVFGAIALGAIAWGEGDEAGFDAGVHGDGLADFVGEAGVDQALIGAGGSRRLGFCVFFGFDARGGFLGHFHAEGNDPIEDTEVPCPAFGDLRLGLAGLGGVQGA
jgi:hypothetical protein